MSLKSMNSRNNDTPEGWDTGRRPAATKNGVPVTGSAPPPPMPLTSPAPSALQAVCRSITELVAASPKPPMKIRLQHGQTTVEVEWPSPVSHAPPVVAAPATAAPAPAAAGQSPAQPTASEDPLHYVSAPMVGTFYHAREPEAPPFVSVGDLVRPGQPVGILEVMKMMSTIEAEVAGRVVEILVPNGRAVEFQQRLIAVEPLTATADPAEVTDGAGEADGEGPGAVMAAGSDARPKR